MTAFTALLPFFYALLFALNMLSLCFRKIRKKYLLWALGFGIIMFICLTAVCFFPERFFTIDAKASENWENETLSTNTVILFGFGYDGRLDHETG